MLLSIFAWSGHAGAPVVSLQAVATLYSAARFAPCARAAFFFPSQSCFRPECPSTAYAQRLRIPTTGTANASECGAHTPALRHVPSHVSVAGSHSIPAASYTRVSSSRASARETSQRGAAPRTSRPPRRRVAVRTDAFSAAIRIPRHQHHESGVCDGSYPRTGSLSPSRRRRRWRRRRSPSPRVV